MKVAGSYIFEAPQRTVLKALQKPTVMTSVLPGSERLTEVGEKIWERGLKIKVGPVQGRFRGRIELLDLQQLESFAEASRRA